MKVLKKNIIFIDYDKKLHGFHVGTDEGKQFLGEETVLYSRFKFIEFLVNTGEIRLSKAYELEKKKSIELVLDNDVQFITALLSIDNDAIETLKYLIDA